MPTAQLVVGNQQNADNSGPITGRAGSFAEVITSDFNGFYFEQVQRGNAYCATSVPAALGALGPNNPTLWNTSDSGNVLVLTRVSIGWDTVGGGPTMQDIQYGVEARMGAETHATDGAVKTFTNIAPANLLLGSPKACKAKFAGAVCTFTTAPSLLAVSGFSQSATVSGFGNQSDPIDGRIILWPGTVFQVGASGTTVPLVTVSIYFIEIPKPNLAA